MQSESILSTHLVKRRRKDILFCNCGLLLEIQKDNSIKPLNRFVHEADSLFLDAEGDEIISLKERKTKSILDNLLKVDLSKTTLKNLINLEKLVKECLQY